MGRLFGAAVMALLLMGPLPVWAAREITVDFATGEVTESEDKLPPGEEVESQAVKSQDETAREIARLKKIIRLQTSLIQRQQAVIREQREKNRRLEDINRGLELMLRSCR